VLGERWRVDWSQRPEARAVAHLLAQQRAGAGPEDLVFTAIKGRRALVAMCQARSLHLQVT
jgi:hypothetical protein